jgi:Fe-S cluster biogenesis protein NfuA
VNVRNDMDPSGIDPFNARLERSLEKIRPYLRADGGDVKFVRMKENGTLELQWQGTCLTCPMSVMTLRAGVERVLLNDLPEVKRVEAVSG